MVDGFCRELQAGVCRPRRWRLIVWQRVKNGWRNSTGMGIRRRTSQWKFFARITAVPINCPSPAAGSTGIGATTGPAAWSRPRSSAGGCRVPARCEPQCEPWRTRSGAPFPFRWNRNGAFDFDLTRFLDTIRSHPDQIQGRLRRTSALTRALCQNATEQRAIFTFGTATERIAPESLIWRRTPLFTARCRPQSEAAHHIQHHNNRPQPAADDKG